MYERLRITVKVEPHCLYFIYVHKFYKRSHGKNYASVEINPN